MDDVVAIPCVVNTIKEFRVVISMFEPKGASSLLPHNFFKMLYTF